MFVVLAIASPAWAAKEVVTSTNPQQDPVVSTPVPNIHASGAPVVTTPSSTSVYQTPASAPTATAPATAPTATAPATAPTPMYNRNYVVGAPPGTTYYYPTRTRFGLFRMITPTYTYSSMNASPTYVDGGQTYYTPVQRRGLFGLFQRRYRPVYQTSVYTPTTNTVPAGTVPAGSVTTGAIPAGTTPGATAPVYTPTTLNVPTGTAPAVTAPARTIPRPPPPPLVIP